MEIAVSVGAGTETAAKNELKRLGIEAPCIDGKFYFEGSGKDVATLNVRLSTAGKVYVRAGKFKAETFDELYDGIRAIEWADIVYADNAVVVNAKSVKSKLFSLTALQSVAKKAIVDKLSLVYGTLPECGAPVYVDINLNADEVSVLINTSGDGLHKRGYRRYVYEAPVKETIAASIIRLSVWNKDRAFLDPFCGSGTFPIEAAMYALNIPSGMYRSFAFDSYKFLDTKSDEIKKLAREEIAWDTETDIRGSDVNPRAVELSELHAAAFGLSKYIRFEVADMRTVESDRRCGVIITNPPYGERLLDERELQKLYADFGKTVRRLDDWSVYLLTAYGDFERYFGKKADKTRKIFNAKLECRLYRYLGKKPEC
ncbi:MAG: class I SAM-dependent RNA methyltransferase [Christensenellales bacterium]